MIYILIAAILPALVLIYFIYRRDNRNPEPVGQLLKAFGYGILSAGIVSLFGGIIDFLITLFYIPIVSEIYIAFVGAAIPEEAAKLFMLWLFLRKNKYFDEYMDGIVYAVCVSMGFAALENIMYLGSSEYWVPVGITRALISVPGHAGFAVLMGYYYSLIRFRPFGTNVNKAMVYLAPVISHGIFDAILMVSDIIPPLSFALSMAFFYFFFKLQKRCSNRIAELVVRDHENHKRDISLT